jgi:hypothetical protein
MSLIWIQTVNFSACLFLLLWKGLPALRAHLLERSHTAKARVQHLHLLLKKATDEKLEARRLMEHLDEELARMKSQDELFLKRLSQETMERSTRYVGTLGRELRSSLEASKQEHFKALFQGFLVQLEGVVEENLKERKVLEDRAVEKAFVELWRKGA